MTVVGVISDTHGLLRPQATAALSGVERILHAGDVCGETILLELERIAPVTAVRGNCDYGGWADALPWTAEVEVDGVWIHMRHILEELDVEPRAAGFGVVLSGHTHRPLIETRRDVLYVNPGSAGPRRFSLPVSVGVLRLDAGKVEAEIVELDV